MSNHTLRIADFFGRHLARPCHRSPQQRGWWRCSRCEAAATSSASHSLQSQQKLRVAATRILRGDYGELTPKNNYVKAAGDDLGLSERQRLELRKQLLEAMPVRTLDSSCFATTDATPQIGSDQDVATSENDICLEEINQMSRHVATFA